MQAILVGLLGVLGPKGIPQNIIKKVTSHMCIKGAFHLQLRNLLVW